MFVDHIRVWARAGKGGDGSCHFRRVAFNPKGGPDGGDGGKGGDVLLRVDDSTDSLKRFFYDPKLRGEDGKPGMRQNMSGKGGKTVSFPVPPGTLVYRCQAASLQESNELAKAGDLEMELVADLVKKGETFVLCAGGQGGKGNVHYKSSTNQAPLEHTPGGEGQEGIFFFELRRMADAGMVGFPNAGKSTLVSKLSAAKPKIAAYPFTTLRPMVGVIEFPGYCRASVADIPGLIEGASENVGLGHEFLRHILRCRLLLFVVDMAGSEGREPIEDLIQLRTEVKLYSEELSQRPWMIVANKMDLPGAEEKLEGFRQRFGKREILPLSAKENRGVDLLRERLREEVGRRPD
ncbi:MAG: GTPase ObgE [Verrucomicrobiota bacterium]